MIVDKVLFSRAPAHIQSVSIIHPGGVLLGFIGLVFGYLVFIHVFVTSAWEQHVSPQGHELSVTELICEILAGETSFVGLLMISGTTTCAFCAVHTEIIQAISKSMPKSQLGQRAGKSIRASFPAAKIRCSRKLVVLGSTVNIAAAAFFFSVHAVYAFSSPNIWIVLYWSHLIIAGMLCLLSALFGLWTIWTARYLTDYIIHGTRKPASVA